jgi:Zn-dependent protease with chaperone function
MASSQVRADLQRLNPFAFPSDTTFRFVLLIVSVLGVSLFVYYTLYWSLRPNSEQTLRFGQDYQRCVDEANATYSVDLFSSAYIDALSKCRSALPVTDHREGQWMIIGALSLLAAALIIYWTFPARKIWREQFLPLTGRDAPEVTSYLTELCREAGLWPPPVFLWHPLRSASGAVAFGHGGRSRVALTGGLVAQFYTDKPVFRAIVLHELAHLRNGDVNKTYFTVAVWQAFVAVALVPFALSLLLQIRQGPGFVANLSFRVLALGGLVYLMRNAVLRARELYADVRASVWDGIEGALRRALDALPRQRHEGVGLLLNVLRVHPDPVERSLTVDATDRLFRMGFWDAFAAGVATTIAASNVELLLYYLTANTRLELIVPALILAPLAVGVVGLGAWRATFGALALGRPPRGLSRLGLGLGLGCVLGQFLSLEGYIEASVYGSSMAVFGFYVVLSTLLLASSVLLVEWLGTGASTWLEVMATSRSPRPAYVVGLIIAGALFALCLGDLYSLYPLGAGVSGLSGFLNLMYILGSYVVNVLAVNPVTLVALISLWAFPLAAWFWRRQFASDLRGSWMFLDSYSQHATFPRLAPLNPSLALKFGLLGGLLFWAVLLALWAGWRLGVGAAAKHRPGVMIAFAFLQVATAALAQAVVAVAVGRRITRVGGVHGLFAAFIGGCVMAAGMIVIIFIFGRKMNPGFAWIVFSQVVDSGALLALLALGVRRLAKFIGHSGVQPTWALLAR